MNKEVMPQFHQTVNEVIEALIKPDCLKRDLFFTLLLTVMKENDFLLLKGIDGGSINIVDFIVSNNKNEKLINEAVLVLNGFQSVPMKMIIACPLNDIILIIATIPELYKENFSICLKLSRYVIMSPLGIPSHFTNLSELFAEFKNKIVNPVKGTILNYHNFPSANLFGLPNDIIHQILLNLPVKDALNLSESCKKLYRIVKEDSLWFRLYNRDFPNKHKSEGNSWQDEYVEVYLLKQAAKSEPKTDVESSFQEFADLPNYVSHVSDSRWEVIL